MTCPVTLNHPELFGALEADEPPEIVADWLLDHGCTLADVLGLWVGEPRMNGGTDVTIWGHPNQPRLPWAVLAAFARNNRPDVRLIQRELGEVERNLGRVPMVSYWQTRVVLVRVGDEPVWLGPYRSPRRPSEYTGKRLVDRYGPVASSNVRIHEHSYRMDVDRSGATALTINVLGCPVRRARDPWVGEYLLWVQKPAAAALPEVADLP